MLIAENSDHAETLSFHFMIRCTEDLFPTYCSVMSEHFKFLEKIEGVEKVIL